MLPHNLISIVVPVYNTEMYLERCLKSLIRQSCKNIEIVVVDDCSTGNCKEIVDGFLKTETRIKYIRHNANKGLFRARVTGAQNAIGEFIAFVDSDDYVSYDFYRVLLSDAETYGADIAIGNTVIEEENGIRTINLLQSHAFPFKYVGSNDEVSKYFYDQRGTIYSWHTIWNKIYRKSLWNKCMPYFEKLDQHIIMTEDIAFSSLLFYYADSIVKSDNEAYFYCKNQNASTNSTRLKVEKYEKNVRDMTAVFDFVEAFHKDVNACENIVVCFSDFRKRYARLWRSIASVEMSSSNNEKVQEYINSFLPGYFDFLSKEDDFFQQFHTPWNGELESLKERIAFGDYKYISFDIFDTLIKRPFYYPTDLISLLEMEYEKMTKGIARFAPLRIEGEIRAREMKNKVDPCVQDITLDEIYEYIQDNYFISENVANALKAAERRLEITFSRARSSVKELYEVAMITGKKIIVVSDMYLDEKTIQTILHKNGYTAYAQLFLSSVYRKTKHTGDLFTAILKSVDVRPKEILHFGDNWTSDYINARKHGMEAVFFPQAIEVFENKIKGVETNNCSKIAFYAAGDCIDHASIMKSLGFRSMLGIIANRYFDNPFRSFNATSDFNMDPFFIGYYPVGMHLAGISQWIREQCSIRGYHSVSFLSRDGFLVKRFFDKYMKLFGDDIVTYYVQSSRKALLPEMLSCPTDFFDLPMEPVNHTPRTVLRLLSFCTRDFTENEIKMATQPINIRMDCPFETRDRMNQFIKLYLDRLYSEEKHEEARALICEYYSKFVSDGNVFFDLGYSGRIPAAISNTLGKAVDVLYIHHENNRINMVVRKGNVRVASYFSQTPVVSGVVREHLLSDPGPSCVGFGRVNGQAEPLFEHSEKTYQDRFIVETIHKGALEFLDDFVSYFKDYWEYVPYDNTEVSYPFEGFIRFPKEADISIFNASFFEDLVYGANENINICEFIKNYIDMINHRQLVQFQAASSNQKHIEGKSRIQRILYYALFDNYTFKLKSKDKLMKYPRIYNMVYCMYNWLKKITQHKKT